MNPIKQRITQFLIGEERSSTEDYMSILEDAQRYIELGVENNGDAILYARKIDGKIHVFGIVGKSIVQGDDLNRFLTAYFADSGGIEAHYKKIANYLYDDIKSKPEAFMLLKSKDKRWKSFRPVKNIDEILANSLNS